MKKVILSLAFLAPFITHAQGLQEYIPEVVSFIYSALIPFFLGVAFLIVIINIVRYFVVESTSNDGREKAKAYLLYSILAFVLILVFWGVIGLLVTATNLTGGNVPTPDIPGYSTGGAGCDTGGVDDPDFDGGGCGW